MLGQRDRVAGERQLAGIEALRDESSVENIEKMAVRVFHARVGLSQGLGALFPERRHLDRRLLVRAARHRQEQEVLPVRQEVRPRMTRFTGRGVRLRRLGDLASRRFHAMNRVHGASVEEDRAAASPRSVGSGRALGDELRRTAGRRDLLELVPDEKRDEAAVGRPPVTRAAVRAGKLLRLEGVDPSHPDRELSRSRRDPGTRSSSRRETSAASASP